MWRRGVLAVLLVSSTPSSFGALGCSPRAETQELPVKAWRAELPSRDKPLDVVLPAHFDDRLPRQRSSYVLRTGVDVPPAMRGKPLTLVIPHMPAMATLQADGAEAMPLDAGLLDSYRATTPHRWRIPSAAIMDGHLDLELRVEHTMSRSAWIDSVPVLTTHPAGGAWVSGVHVFNTVLATGALAAAVIVSALYGFLYLSLRDKRRRAHGWFALGAICGAVYPAFLLGLTQPVLGGYDAAFLMVSLVLGCLAAMNFARAYADQGKPSRAWWLVFAAVLLAAILARNPFYSILVLAPVVVLVTLATAFAQFVFLARLRRMGERPPAVIYGIAFAWPAVVLLGLPDVIAWLGQGESSGGVRTACLGIAGIAIYQATALSRAHLLSLARADALVAELNERVKLQEAKNREVELLNDELRRQIAARSRELAEKLLLMSEDDSEPPPDLEAGAVVEERYRVIQALGAGGMGAVYEVERIVDEKHFALKALSSHGDPQQRARFAREAQIVANVNHPNVVSIVDVDVAKTGYLFLVMELVTGGTTLHDVRRRHRDIPWTLGVLAQVAEGLHAVHSAGIIHRDLKPGNILLSRGADGRRPDVKITDFGISSLQPEGRPSSAHMMRSQLDSLPAAGEASSAPPPVYISQIEAERQGLAPPVVVFDSRDDVLSSAPLTSSDSEDTAIDVLTSDIGPSSTPRPASTAPKETASEGAVERGRKMPSRPVRTPSAPLTETGIIFGTPQYMAQELTAGTKNATRASDVFSLGIIAFELLTGKRPFIEAPVAAKLDGRPLPPIPDFQRYCPTLPSGIAKLLARAMSHDPRERPSARELATALRDAADKLSGQVMGPSVGRATE